MPDYSRGKIYKLVNNVDDKIYVGATCGTLRLRKSCHKCHSKKNPDRPVYKHLNEVGWENVNIILIEEIKCENKMELSRRERHWIDELKPVLNLCLPLRTKAEHYQDNREAILIWGKQYRDDNKEHMKQYAREHKEAISVRMKKYRQDNEEKLSILRNRKINCPCGGKYTHSNRVVHFRTKKHMKYSEAV